MGERILYMVRHGEMDRDAFAKVQFKAGLTARGRRQARLAARRLGGLRVHAIHCSTIGRAAETGAIFATQFPAVRVRPTRLLWELPNRSPVDDPEWQKVVAAHMPRAKKAFAEYARPTRQTRRVEILISHGNLISYFVCRALGLSAESWVSLGTSHTGITQLRITGPGKVQVVCHNDTGHLPDLLLS